MKYEDLTGQKFNDLIGYAKDIADGRRFMFKCVCEKIKNIRKADVKSGKSTSCGCMGIKRISASKIKHSDCDTKLYYVWGSMLRRTRDKKNLNYGGRGIKVCKDWEDYRVFKDWALEKGYTQGLTIERIKVNEGYSPDNCKWVTMAEQGSNKRNSIKIEIDGRILGLVEAAKIYGVPKASINRRYHECLTGQDLVKPIKRRNNAF